MAPLLKFLSNDNLCADAESRRLLKAIFEKISAEPNFLEAWEKFLDQKKITDDFVCGLIKTQARKGKMANKKKWEAFQKNFAIPLHSTTKTHKQTCTITTRAGHTVAGLKIVPSPIVVWNANGVRARWTAPHNELTHLVHTTNPDPVHS